MSDNAFEPSEYAALTPPKSASVPAIIAGVLAIILGVLGLPCGCFGLVGGAAGSATDMSTLLEPGVREAFQIYQEAMAPYQLIGLVLVAVGLVVSVIEIIAGVLALTGRSKPLFAVALGLMAWHVLVSGLWPILVQVLNWGALQDYLAVVSQTPAGAGTSLGIYLGLAINIVVAAVLTLIWGAIAGASFRG